MTVTNVLRFAGTVHLMANDTVQLVVWSETDASFIIHDETSWSIAALNTSVAALARLNAAQAFTVASVFQELTGTMLATGNPLFTLGASFDTPRFNATVKGIYWCSASAHILSALTLTRAVLAVNRGGTTITDECESGLCVYVPGCCWDSLPYEIHLARACDQ